MRPCTHKILSACRLPVAMIIVAAAFFGLAAGARAADSRDEECVKCHQQLWDEAITKAYVHKPFLEKKCHFCHIAEIDDNKVNRGFMTDREVRWLANSRMAVANHWLFVDAGEAAGKVVVDIQIPGKKNLRREITIPSAEKIPEITNDGTPPAISDVRVPAVERGLFLTATIAWHTEDASTSQVWYGAKKINKKSKLNSELSQDHIVIISGLKPNRDYSFKVVSTDLFGNTGKSGVHRFSTRNARRNRHKKQSIRPAGRNHKKLEIERKIYRNGDRLVFKFTANSPVRVALGVYRDTPADGEDGAGIANAPAPDRHRLKDALTTNNTVCVPCHGVYVKGRNHPVNVPPKPGMVIPEDYFVLGNGNITCMSCHSAHSSDYEYRLVRSSKRDLCIGCHVAKI